MDERNTAAWDLYYDSTNEGWTIKNVYTGKYYNDPTKDATSDDPAYFTFCDVNKSVDQNVDISVGGDTRNYQLYVPSNAAENCPLVISLHGASGHSTDYSPFRTAVADEEGCIVAYPQGKLQHFPVFGQDVTGWDASGEENEDVEFLRAVIEDVASKYQIDRKRIYCCGFSNGGMMTYAMANACSDEIAAFASISGYPINEFHLRHTGERPVPFLHIHGKADDFVLYAKMPTIVDEMVARLGANPVPATTSGSGYTKNVYAAADGSFPYIYYEIDGMGHNDYTANTEAGSSAQTMWNFFEQYTLDTPCDQTLKWAPRIEEDGYAPAEHGWTMNSGTTLLQFGGDQKTDGNKNVYHSLQFNSGTYTLSFTSTGAAGKKIGVTIEKLTSPNTVVLNTTVNVGADAELSFNVSDGWGEYRLTMTRPDAGDAITISDITIKQTTDTDGTKTPLLLLKNGTINTTDFDVTPIAPSTLTTDNLYAATFTSTNGNPSNTFKYENLDVSDYDKAVVKYTIEAGNGDWEINLPSGSFTALPVGTDQTYEIDLSDVDTYGDFTIFSWFHTGKSITISEVYLWKEEIPEEYPVLEFDEYGKATTDKIYLKATGGLSYDAETGVLTSDGTEGTLVLEYDEAVDLRNLFHFNVVRSGNDNIANRLKFYDEDGAEINTWNSIKWSNTWNKDGIDNNATNAFINHKPVKKLVWQSDADAAKAEMTMTITSVQFILKTISCAKAGETQLKTLAWNKIDGSGTATPDWNMNVATDTYYGNYSSDPTHYADLTDYEELRIYRDNNDGFRAFFINAAGNGTNTISGANATWNADEKYWSVDLSTIEKWDSKVALKSIKSASSGVNNIVKNIVVYNTPAAHAPKYILTGSGMQLAETVAALADATATGIDATGVTGITTNSEAGRTLLTSANPNCLFLGKFGNGYLANTKNVVDGSTCNNLVLTDGYPFEAPTNFTATAANYTTTISAAGAGTLCLPFAATIPDGVTAYTLSYVSGNDAATLTPVETTIPANTPVLLNGSGAATFTGSGAVDADATNVSGALTGVFANTAVPLNSYVLQNGASGIGFYKVTSDITAKPFRAYLTAQLAGVKDFLSIIFDEATAVQSLSNSQEPMANSEIFNLAGQRMSKLQRGINIVNGKKIMVK